MRVRACVVAGVLSLLTACTSLPAGTATIEPSPSSPSASAPASPSISPSATIAPASGVPFSPPTECKVVAIGAQQWRFDCDEPNNTNARGTLNAPLTGQGWRMCASGLAGAQWGKAELMVTVSEGSGVPGEGFVVRVDPITSDCALKVSTADPSRSFEVMAQAFVGSELGWVAAWRTDAKAFFHTVDGGRTWTELALPADVAYVAELQFVDERNGWMLGFAGRGFQYGCDQAAPADLPRCRDILLRTRDGGRTWTSLRVMALAPAGSPGLKEIQLVDAMTGWLLERAGPAPCEIGKPCFNLLSTTDGGNQWRTVLARTAMTDLRFVDRTHGWSLVPSEGGVDVMATADGGTTWSRQIAGGELATVHETATSGWWTAPGCGGFLGEPFFVDSQRGWIGLQRGVGGLSGSNAAGLIATADGGATWSCVDGLPSEDVSLVWFADASHGWVTTRSDFAGPGRGGARIWRTD